MTSDEEFKKVVLEKLKELDKVEEVLQISKKIEGEITEVKKELTEVKEEALKTTAKVTLLEAENATFKKKLLDLEAKLDTMENQSRRNNLLVKGVPESKGETWLDCKKTVIRIAQEAGVRIQTQDIERAHRLQSKTTPRPIIAKLVYFQDKEDIIRNQRRIANSDITIAEDYSKLIQEERRELFKVMQDKRKEDKYAVVKFNKLQVEEEVFRYDWESKTLIKVGDAKKPKRNPVENNRKRRRSIRANTDSPYQESKMGKEESNQDKGGSSRPRRIQTKTNSEDVNRTKDTNSENRSNTEEGEGESTVPDAKGNSKKPGTTKETDKKTRAT